MLGVWSVSSVAIVTYQRLDSLVCGSLSRDATTTLGTSERAITCQDGETENDTGGKIPCL